MITGRVFCKLQAPKDSFESVFAEKTDFLKSKTKGTVATEIAAEITNTNTSKPVETPKEKALAAKTGAIVCARPAIAQATPKLSP